MVDILGKYELSLNYQTDLKENLKKLINTNGIEKYDKGDLRNCYTAINRNLLKLSQAKEKRKKKEKVLGEYWSIYFTEPVLKEHSQAKGVYNFRNPGFVLLFWN